MKRRSSQKTSSNGIVLPLMAIQGIRNIVPPTNPQTGTKRGYKEVVETGIDRHSPPPAASAALKAILKIEGDAMGTLNVQEMFNKTIDGGLFTS